MPKFIFEDFIHIAKKYRITILTTVLAVHMRIVKSPLVTDHFDSLLYAQSRAAPMGVELQELVKKKLNCNVGQA